MARSRLTHLVHELRRRKVLRAAAIYCIFGWGATVGVADLFPAFGLPGWSVRAFGIAVVGGFFIVVTLAWLFEWTPMGLILDDRRRFLRRHLAADPAGASNEQPDVWVRAAWQDVAGRHARIFPGDFVIGRGNECELQIEDPLVSRRHARVVAETHGWYVEDLDSRNGTWVRGKRVTSLALGEHTTLELASGGPTVALQVVGATSTTTVLPDVQTGDHAF